MVIDPKTIPTKDLHQFILASVSPRPIAFVSTIAPDGTHNLAPYSFFNAFSSNPPILVFSSNRRVDGNTTKDTLHNILQNKEAVINVVSYDMVRKMAVASVEYPADVSEFEKAGFTPTASDLVAPPRVAESPVSMECKVQDVITLGDQGGAGHLIICNVVRMHIKDEVLTEKGRIDPNKIDLVARMGGLYYLRASGDNLFQLNQEVNKIPVGYDALPEHIKHSSILSANHIGMLAGMLEKPNEDAIASAKVNFGNATPESIHSAAVSMLDAGEVVQAAALLWTIKI